MIALNKIRPNVVLKLTDIHLNSFFVLLRSMCLFCNSVSITNFAIFFLSLVLSGIFMVELENSLVPTLNQSMTLWRRFVDDTITFVKTIELLTF